MERAEANLIPPIAQQLVPQVSMTVLPGSSKFLRFDSFRFTSFGGDIRKYPQFRTEFIKHIEPRCAADELAIVLKR